MSSPYCYPDSKVLINHLNIRNQEELHHFERFHTARRAMEMRFNPIKGDFDLDHLKAMHQQLFQDVYPFSGQLRNVNIGKSGFWFCEKDMINRLADQTFPQLKAENHLKGLSKEEFASRSAYYYTEINYMHPFREGNGRTTREFFGQLAKEAGYELNWQEVPKEEYFQAVKQTDNPTNREALVKVFEKCLSPVKDDFQMDKWIQPEQPMKLIDVLKIPNGVPDQTAKIDAAELAKLVERYSIDQIGHNERVKVKFKDDDTIHTIPLENHQYLNKELKNSLLDDIAKHTQHTIQNQFEMGQ
ncbi:Fic/DOC family protein [Paenibacillus agilis]|uniref:protein adenylyltransferase n=1 Tax=Paenibacillus agilis TaxID=3020863 RepID=A0A559ID66_9BACL|nr:Fic family protein [Paenibacillus agilis]TVX85584.1 hypothetical protein FPZ44_24830 [Paenibacillus agilis]